MEEKVIDLKINRLKRETYESMKSSGQINDDEIYLVKEDSVNAEGERVVNVKDPVDDTDAANKKYVDFKVNQNTIKIDNEITRSSELDELLKGNIELLNTSLEDLKVEVSEKYGRDSSPTFVKIYGKELRASNGNNQWLTLGCGKLDNGVLCWLGAITNGDYIYDQPWRNELQVTDNPKNVIIKRFQKDASNPAVKWVLPSPLSGNTVTMLQEAPTKTTINKLSDSASNADIISTISSIIDVLKYLKICA